MRIGHALQQGVLGPLGRARVAPELGQGGRVHRGQVASPRRPRNRRASHGDRARSLRRGLPAVPDLTQLDLTGPHEVLSRLPGARTHLVWKTLEGARSEKGLTILPTVTLEDCPRLDLLCIPGGRGVNALLNDPLIVEFVRRIALHARYVTSVCTGSLLLGAAGLLRGRRAATHWAFRDLLPASGATPVAERVVVDGRLITGGGVTSGIDFGLRLAAELAGEKVARAIQLGIEYDPQPPFDSGSPERADPALVELIRATLSPERAEAVARAATALESRQ
ncbi:MAG: DJ-1/PfpI family protein [Proteobacteria bacterium]|nr:DJ-1/PfpI family protein [Pseudomonadota bacterium]